MKLINVTLLEEITRLAIKSPRKRMNYNFHESGDEMIQRMLNALEPGTYLAPHRHTDKIEVFLLLKGKLTVLFFDDTGNVTSLIILDPLAGQYGVEIPKGVWHTIVVEMSGTVIYEIKEGPYVPNVGIDFAPWAPVTENEHACTQYLVKLKNIITTFTN